MKEKEDINFRIIKKLQGDEYKKHISGFLVEAIREEFREQKRWQFKETYDSMIEKYANRENLQK
jgi:hypothetical protein